MRYRIYRNTKTDEEVMEDDWTNYAKEKFGIEVNPQGKNGELTKDQVEFLVTFTEWYFSDNWIEEEIEDDDIPPDLEAELERADMLYQENLDKKWGID